MENVARGRIKNVQGDSKCRGRQCWGSILQSEMWVKVGRLEARVSRIRQCKTSWRSGMRECRSSHFSVAFGMQWRWFFKGILQDETFIFLLCQMAWVSKGSSCMNSVTYWTFAVFFFFFLILKNIWSTDMSNILIIIFFSGGSMCEWTRKYEVILWEIILEQPWYLISLTS